MYAFGRFMGFYVFSCLLAINIREGRFLFRCHQDYIVYVLEYYSKGNNIDISTVFFVHCSKPPFYVILRVFFCFSVISSNIHLSLLTSAFAFCCFVIILVTLRLGLAIISSFFFLLIPSLPSSVLTLFYGVPSSTSSSRRPSRLAAD